MSVIPFFHRLSAQLQLGDLRNQPKRVSGGLLHTMFRLDTSSGVYAIKLLNPNVMKRSESIRNYERTDRLEELLDKNKIPIIPSLVFNDKKLQLMDGRYFYVYPWYEGKSIKTEEVTQDHCVKISQVLARIHQLDYREERKPHEVLQIQWDYYMQLAQDQNQLIYELLKKHLNCLNKAQNEGNQAVLKLPAGLVLCHNDMDRKNVLWLKNEFKIIDCECLDFNNPYLELIELALCWSHFESFHLDFELFRIFISTYFTNKTNEDRDWKAIYQSNRGRLEWLEYNLKRALLIECIDQEEQGLGIEQVQATLEQIVYYDEIQDQIIETLDDIFKTQSKHSVK